MTFEQIRQIWNRIWFAPVSPAPICLYRIFYGAQLFLCSLFMMGDILVFFGPKGLVSIPTIQSYEHSARFSLLFWLPNSDGSVIFIYVGILLLSMLVTLGLFTRPSLLLLLIFLVSLHHRNPAVLNSGDTFFRVAGFLLLLSPCGEMFSLDCRMKGKQKGADFDAWAITSEPWAQRLLQLQIAAVYCQTFWSKIQGDTWWNGTAVYFATRLEELSRFPVPFIFDDLFCIKLMTYFALAVEVALWTTIWIRELRYWTILAGITLHLAIDWSMNIPLFEYIMIASFINFVYPEHVKLFTKWLSVKWHALRTAAP